MLRDLVVLMMSISDNTAADVLLRRIGTDAVDAVCRDLGMADTRVYGGSPPPSRGWCRRPAPRR
ncbi:serine hydrolase [Streptomyces sp. M19]